MKAPLPDCGVEGCTTRAKAHRTLGGPGLCPTHETRLRQHGDVHAVKRAGYSFDYADTGCDLEPSCLNCRLPRCRYDMEPGEVMHLVRVREARRRAASRS